MALCCLILSRDSQEISVLECILSSLRVNSIIEADLSLAGIRLKKSKVDAVIADCDLQGVEAFVRNLQASSGIDSEPVLVLCGSQPRNYLEEFGAEFIAKKPISVAEAVHTLGAARNLILQGRLSYHRQELNTPIAIIRPQQKISANLLNLSQSGMRIRLTEPQSLNGDVGIHFMLPGTQVPIDAQGKVAWADDGGNAGIRLASMTEPMKRDLRLWLEQQYFQHSSG